MKFIFLPVLFSILIATGCGGGDSAEALAHFEAGVALEREGRVEESISEYTEAIRLDPESSGAYLYRGFAFSLLGQHQRAIDDYDQAIRIVPRSPVAYISRGQAYGILGEFALSIQDLDQVLQLFPQLAIAYSIRGTTYLNQSLIEGDMSLVEEAVENYDEAIRLNLDLELEQPGPELRIGGPREQRLANAYDGRGRAHFILGQFQKSVEDLGEATRLDPELPLSYAIRARVYTLLGKDDEAQADIELAVALGMDRIFLERAVEELKRQR